MPNPLNLSSQMVYQSCYHAIVIITRKVEFVILRKGVCCTELSTYILSYDCLVFEATFTLYNWLAILTQLYDPNPEMKIALI